MIMKINKDIAIELLECLSVDGESSSGPGWEDFPLDFKMVSNELIDTDRWSNLHTVVYQDLTTLKFYASSYSVGATEQQDESPYEDEDDEIEFIEVTPVEVTVIAYRAVK